MKKLRGKLNSEKGAVMVIALLFFLVCALVAAVIVAAASMNAGRIEKRYDEQKAYLAASSAAQLLQADFANMTFEAEREEWTYACNKTYEHTASWLKAPGLQEWEKTKDCKDALSLDIADFITETAFKICKSTTSAAADSVYKSNVYTLKADKLTDVTTTVDVQVFNGPSKKYDIKCIIKSVTDKGSSYTMSLYIKAKPDTNTSTVTIGENASKSDTHTVATEKYDWVAGKYVEITEERTYQYDIKTYTMTVTWTKGTIQKGDAS